MTDAHQPGGRLPPASAGGERPKLPLRHLIQALRPLQWTKNLLVFVAPAAAEVLTHGHAALHAVAAFAIFSAAASGTYLVNDAADAEADRRHPDKKNRPVAGGDVSERLSVGVGASLIAAALVSSWFLGPWKLLLVIGAYAVISVAYSLGLKHQSVIELAAVSSCFLLRAIAGGVATHAPLSGWLLLVASFGALFVVTGKRTAEHVRLGDARGEHRAVLDRYTLGFLRSTLAVTAAVTVAAYFLWVFERSGVTSSAGHHIVWVQLTVIPASLGVLHLGRLFFAGQGGKPEDLVLHDHVLQLLAVLWLALFAVGLYA